MWFSKNHIQQKSIVISHNHGHNEQRIRNVFPFLMTMVSLVFLNMRQRKNYYTFVPIPSHYGFSYNVKL